MRYYIYTYFEEISSFNAQIFEFQANYMVKYSEKKFD